MQLEKTNITHIFFCWRFKTVQLLTGLKNNSTLLLDFPKIWAWISVKINMHILPLKRDNSKRIDNVLKINGVKVQQVDEGECYKYLGEDENISYLATVNKERVF